VNIADDVERAGFVFLVVVERDALKNDGLGFFRRGEDQDVAKTFAFEAAEGAAKILQLVVGNVIAEAAIGADVVAILANSFGHVENDGDGEAVILAGQFDEWFAVFGLDVGGVSDGEAASGEALCGDVVAARLFSSSETRARQ